MRRKYTWNERLVPEDTREKIILQSQFLKACPTSNWSRWNSPVIGVASIPRPQKARYDVQLQTDPILYEDRGTSPPEKNSIGVQVLIRKESDPTSFTRFLESTTELMCKELVVKKDNPIVETEQDYQATWWQIQQRSHISEEKIARLKTKPVSLEYQFLRPETWYKYEFAGGSCVSWNSKGTEMAVGYGARYHEGWCRHLSVPVNIWSFQPRHMKKNGRPTYMIPFDSCVTKLKFHPVLWNYLAVGLFTGETALIDLYESDREPEKIDISSILTPKNKNWKQAESGFSRKILNSTSTHKVTRSDRYEFKHANAFVTVDGGCHIDELVSMQWVPCTDTQAAFLSHLCQRPSKYFLVTASKDGFIGVWSIERETGQFNLERRYLVMASAIPHEFWPKGTSHYQMSCFLQQLRLEAFDCIDPSYFICSTIGGYVFSGTLMSNCEISETEYRQYRSKASLILDPHVLLLYQDSEGPSKILRSPFHPDVYAYITPFGRLTIRNLKNTVESIQDVAVEEDFRIPLRDFEWSPQRPMLIAVLVKSSIKFYDFLIHSWKCVMTIVHEVPIYSNISFNVTRSDWLLGADGNGTACIWKLPAQLFEVEDKIGSDEMTNFLEFVKPPMELSEYQFQYNEEDLADIIECADLDETFQEDSMDDFESTYSHLPSSQMKFESETYVRSDIWSSGSKAWTTRLERDKFIYNAMREARIKSGQDTAESVISEAEFLESWKSFEQGLEQKDSSGLKSQCTSCNETLQETPNCI